MDIISVNRYFGWYDTPAALDTIQTDMSKDLDAWYSVYKKAVIITEYGAGAIIGVHEVREGAGWHGNLTDPTNILLQDPPVMYSEEYQVEHIPKPLLKHYIDGYFYV